MRGVVGLALACVLALCVNSVARAAEPADPIQAAREAILDGRVDEASRILDAATDVDATEASLLRGLIALQRGNATAAAEHLERVVAAAPDRYVAWAYLAQARLQMDDDAGALAALDRTGELDQEVPGLHVLRARALEGIGRRGEGLDVLDAALATWPESHELNEERTFFFLRADLSAAAVDAAQAYREVAPQEPRTWALVAEAYRRGGRDEEATEVLEEAHLRFPESAAIGEQLAYTYAVRDMPLTAARLYATESYRGSWRAFEAADQLRLAGRYDEALAWNARVEDDARRLPQRLAILVGAERFARAAVAGDLADARGVLDDASLYVYGYAAVFAGRDELARTLVDRLRAAGRDAEAERLDDLATRCAAEPWRCR